jgi:hypothetical protein
LEHFNKTSEKLFPEVLYMNNFILIILLIILLLKFLVKPFPLQEGMTPDDKKHYAKRLELMKKAAYGKIQMKDGKVVEKKQNLDGIKSSLFMKAKEESEQAMLSEDEKKEIAGVASTLWMKVKKETEPSWQEEEGMKQFLEALKTPGVEVPSPGGDMSAAFQKLIDKGPPPPRGPPLEYNDKQWDKGGKGPGKDGAAGPGNAWTPPANPTAKEIEKGHMHRMVWACAHSAKDLKKKVKLTLKAHKKWGQRLQGPSIAVMIWPGLDAACMIPVPCFAGTISAIAQCAATLLSWMDSRGWTWMSMASAEYNIVRHRMAVKRFSEWVKQRKKFGCWEKKTDTRKPFPDMWNVFRKAIPPKIDTGKQPAKVAPRYITSADTEKIDMLMPMAMAAAVIAKTVVGIAHKATIVAIIVNKIAVAAFPVMPAAKALVIAATVCWTAADKSCEIAKQITFDLAHEVLKFERSRIAACSMPGMMAVDPRSIMYGMKIKKVPPFLKIGDDLTGKGHKEEPDEKGSFTAPPWMSL